MELVEKEAIPKDCQGVWCVGVDARERLVRHVLSSFFPRAVFWRSRGGVDGGVWGRCISFLLGGLSV